jgi:predicted nucleic acid-binding protein
MDDDGSLPGQIRNAARGEPYVMVGATTTLMCRRGRHHDKRAITLAELSAGPHLVRPDNEQDEYYEHAERARRLDVLQRAENEFDPIPFDSEAARAFGQVTAAVRAVGRTPRRRTVDLMIASTAIAAGLPLFTTNPDDFAGLTSLLAVIPVTRPQAPKDR